MTFTKSTYMTLHKRHDGVVVPVSSAALGTLVPSNVFDLDKTILTSYNSADAVGTWTNAEATPADGEAKAAYSFFSLTGSSAVGDSGEASAFWFGENSTTAGFVILSANASAPVNNTDFLNNIQRTDVSSPTTFCTTFRVCSLPTTRRGLMGNVSASNQARSLAVVLTSAGEIQAWQHTPGNGNTMKTTLLSSGAIVVNTNYFLAVGFNYFTGDAKVWLNTTTGTSIALITASAGFNASRSGVFNIWGQGDNNSPAGASTQIIYAFSMFNEILSDNDVSVVKDHYQTSARQNRIY